jgi:histidine triad (HIT) family protein
VRNEIPSKKIYEDNDVVAFLDINPANPGHTLVASKKHYESIIDADNAVLSKLIQVTKTVAKTIKEKLNTDGINVIQNNGKHAGQLVNHIHFHIIPRYPNDKVMISYQRAQITEKDLDEIQKKLTTTKKEAKPEDWEFRF